MLMDNSRPNMGIVSLEGIMVCSAFDIYYFIFSYIDISNVLWYFLTFCYIIIIFFFETWQTNKVLYISAQTRK